MTVGLLALAQSAWALTPTVTEFTSGLNSGAFAEGGIAAGPDGNLWFDDYGTTKAIGRITPAGTIAEFSSGLNSGSFPEEIAAGPDGNLWFTDDGSTPAIGRITPAGAITEYPLGSGHAPANGIAAGPDGSLWFTDRGTTSAIGEIDPNTHAISEFSSGLNSGSKPKDIVAGPDGNLWFTDDGTTKAIGEINPTTDAINEFTQPGASTIALGPDGNLWFTYDVKIAQFNPTTHAVKEFSGFNGSPQGVATGPDGNLWFGDEGTSQGWVGRMTTSGTINEFSTSSGRVPAYLAVGSDGNMWFSEGSAIGRITTPPTAETSSATATGPTSWTVSGVANGHAQPTSFHVEYGPVGGSTTNTPEQSLGTTSGDTPVSAMLTGLTVNTRYQARVVVTNPTDTTAGEFLTFTTGAAPGSTVTAPTATKDSISNFAIKPSTFTAANSGGPLVAARKRGAIVSYTGTQPATTTFTVQRPTAGRRQGHSCVKQTKRNRKHRRCTRWVNVGSFTHTDTAGANRFRFTGRIHGRKLKPGKYRLRAIPRNSAGTGRAVTKSFRVKK